MAIVRRRYRVSNRRFALRLRDAVVATFDGLVTLPDAGGQILQLPTLQVNQRDLLMQLSSFDLRLFDLEVLAVHALVDCGDLDLELCCHLILSMPLLGQLVLDDCELGTHPVDVVRPMPLRLLYCLCGSVVALLEAYNLFVLRLNHFVIGEDDGLGDLDFAAPRPYLILNIVRL